MGEHDRKLTIDQFEFQIDGHTSPLDEVKTANININLGHVNMNGNGEGTGTGRPAPISFNDRGTSLESIKLDEVMGLMGKPAALGDSDRMGTLGTLDSNDFDNSKIAI